MSYLTTTVNISSATQIIASDTVDRYVYLSFGPSAAGYCYIAFNSTDVSGNAFVYIVNGGGGGDPESTPQRGFVLPAGLPLWGLAGSQSTVYALVTKVPAAQLSLGSC